jgi:photosystem II stability/assembly factor-like uncharacterized protein
MKKLIFTLITIATFFLAPLTSEASHFRYGHVTWTRVPGTRDVTFTITTAWREDATETIAFNFGDGTSVTGVLGTEIQYVPGSHRVFQLQVTHTYATDGPFTAYLYDCCRISTLQNGADGYFTVSSVVCLANNNVGSPVCSSPVIIEMSAGSVNQYQLITSEPDGSGITYSATAIQADNYVPTVGTNVASVSSTGLVSWNTTGAVAGQLYQMKVSLSDGCAKSEVDFIIKITACSSTPASAILSGTQSINLGQSANLNITLNGTPPWTYRLSGTTTDVTTSTTPTTVSVTPTVLGANTYTLTSVSNACGNGNVSGNAVVTTSVPPALIACYPFNGNAQDSKGTNHGTVNGATLTTDRFGNANSAYNFDGTSNYIAIPGTSLAVSQYTYSAWVNASELPAYGEARTILSVGNAGGDQFLMLLNNSATNGPGWNYGSYMGYTIPVLPPLLSYTSVVANNWVHFVVVRSSSDRKIYINGQLSVSNTASGGPYYSTPILGAIGARYNNTQIQTFKGAIDDVKIYSGTLNDAQVQALYLAEQQCPTIETGGLLAVTSLSSTTACVGGNVTVNVITNNINTSTSAISVQLSDALGSFANPVQIGTGTSNTIICTIPSNLAGGKYKIRAVFGISPNQVISVNTLPLTLNPKLTIIPNITTANTTICNANSVTLSATGCLLNTYVWTGGLTGSSITVSPSTTKSYKVACVATPCVGDSSSAVTITVSPKPSPPSITTASTSICSGSSITLNATGCVGGTYFWTGGLTGSSISVSPIVTKSYKVACLINNCTSDSTNAVVITVNAKPLPPNISTASLIICSGSSAVLSAVGCIGGSYTWTGGLIGNNITVSPTVTKTYNAVCRINNCVSDSSNALVITVNPKPTTPTVSVSNSTVCSGVSTTLTATGCIGGMVFWTGGLSGSSVTVAPTSTKAYKAICLANNCSSDSSAASTITVTTLPSFIITSNRLSAFCGGDSAILTASGCSGTLLWFNGSTASSILVYPQTTTTYTATCNVVNSCLFPQQITVSTIVTPNITAPTTSLLCGQTITLTANNVTSGSNIQWRKDGVDIANATNLTLSINSAGSYDFRVGATAVVQSETFFTYNNDDDQKIQFMDRNRGFYLISSIIKKTTDGGNTWNNIYVGTTVKDFYFSDLNNGWAIEDHNILKTVDGGNTWTIYGTSFPSFNLKKISFASSTVGIIATDNNKTISTSNGGLNWTLNSASIFSTGLTNSINEIKHISNSNTVFAISNYGYSGLLSKSIDNGATWSNNTVFNNTFLQTIEFTNSTNGCMGSDYGTILKTNDGGNTWSNATVYDNNSDYVIRKIDFIDSQVGYAIGSRNIYKTSNGGMTWNKFKEYNTSGSGSNKIDFVSEDNGWFIYCAFPYPQKVVLTKISTPQCSTTPKVMTNICCSTFESIKSGSWTDPTTWSCNRIPTSTDEVIINIGHFITVPAGNHFAKRINHKGGFLLMQNSTNLKLSN